MAQVYLSNQLINSGQAVDLNTAQLPLSMSWNANPAQLHTVVMYDTSVPRADAPVESPYVHFLAVNVPGINIPAGNILIPYSSPSPPANSGLHTYVINVLSQLGPVSVPYQLNRSKFSLAEFVQNYRLSPMYQHSFNVEGRTTYTRAYQPRSTRTVKYDGVMDKSQWMNSQVPEDEQKYCRCIIESAGKQSGECLTGKLWYHRVGGYSCSNPYAVCGRVGARGECGKNYIFENLPDAELKGYSNLNKIPVPSPYNRQQLLQNIQTWKQQKGY